MKIEFHQDGYRLCGSLDRLDSTRFERLVNEARSLPPEEAAEAYGRALDLWRANDSFIGVDSVLVDGARHRLELLRIETLLLLANSELVSGQGAESVEPLREVFDREPERDDVAIALANLLAFRGRQTRSLRTIERHRSRLAESGRVPAPELLELEGRILRHDLSAPVRPSVGGAQEATNEFGPQIVLGRDELRDRLVREFERGPVVLVGEAGVGKTTLARSTSRDLDEQRRTVWVRAHREPMRPIQVIADVVDHLAESHPLEFDRHTEAPPVAAAVARLLGQTAQSHPAVGRDRLIGLLVGLLRSILHDLDSLLIVEDGQWLDNSSAEVLAGLMSDSPPPILVTSRQRLPRLPATVVEVPAFTVAEVAQLLGRTLPVRASESLAEELHSETGGNGLFLRLRLDLLAQGSLGTELPMTVLHAVHERIKDFSSATRNALQTAALLGHRFPLAPLSSVHPGAVDLLSSAVDEHLVRIDERSQSGEFAHGLVADALVSTLTAAMRTTRHDQLCTALTERGAPAVAIAVQAMGSVDLDPIRASGSCVAAADELSAVFEWAGVLDWARSGLGVIADYGMDDPRREATLRLHAGSALRRSIQPGSAEQLRRAAELVRSSSHEELFVRIVTELCLHGHTTQAGSVDREAFGYLQLALEADVDMPLRMELRSAAATLLTVSDQANWARSLYREALDLAERSGDEAASRAVWMNAHLGLSHPADMADRRRMARSLLSFDDAEAQWEGRFLGIGLALIDGDRDRFEQAVGELSRLTSVVKQRDHQRALVHVEAVEAFINGELERAETLADEAFRSALDAYPQSWALSIYAALLMPVREVQGRTGELAEAVAELRRLSPEFVTWSVVSACVAYASGDAATMQRELLELSSRGFEFVEDLTWTAASTVIARPVLALGDAEAASVLYERLLPYSGVLTWNGLSTHGPVDAGLACFAAALGDEEAVRRHVELARSSTERLGAPHLLWPELSALLAQEGDVAPNRQ